MPWQTTATPSVAATRQVIYQTPTHIHPHPSQIASPTLRRSCISWLRWLAYSSLSSRPSPRSAILFKASHIDHFNDFLHPQELAQDTPHEPYRKRRPLRCLGRPLQPLLQSCSSPLRSWRTWNLVRSCPPPHSPLFALFLFFNLNLNSTRKNDRCPAAQMRPTFTLYARVVYLLQSPDLLLQVDNPLLISCPGAQATCHLIQNYRST